MATHDKSQVIAARNPAENAPDMELTNESLAFEWTLAPKDKEEIFKCRGEDNQRLFAVLLCTLRNRGAFPDSDSKTSLKVVNYINRQLGFDPILTFDLSSREATRNEYEQRVCYHLGYRRFDEKIEENLKKTIANQLRIGASEEKLLALVQESLQSWKIIPPAQTTLKRIISSTSTQYENEVFEAFEKKMPEDLRREIALLLDIPNESRISELASLKQYPPEATAQTILKYIERYEKLRELRVHEINLGDFSVQKIIELSQVAKRHDVNTIKRFPQVKRNAIVGCFLVESLKTVLDHIVEMHDQFLLKMKRRSGLFYEKKHRLLRKSHKKSLKMILQFTDDTLRLENNPDENLDDLFGMYPASEIRLAKESCEVFLKLEEHGLLGELQKRYSNFREYVPRFFKLPFHGEAGAEPILRGLEIVKKLDSGEIKKLPEDLPLQFVPSAWEKSLENGDGTINRAVWEISLGFAVRDALRSGALYLPESRKYLSFWEMVYEAKKWETERLDILNTMKIPCQFDEVLVELQKEFDELAWVTEKGLPTNPIASIKKGRLQLKRLKALEVSKETKRLKHMIETSLPRVRIEKLLMDVDHWCGFSNSFRALDGYKPRVANRREVLMASIIAHGTNLGISSMGESAEGITVDMLQHMSRWFLRESTLKAANTTLVNHHAQLSLSSVWGDGTISSSDGQRFRVRQKSLIGSVYPRYFGYYDRAVSIYTHMSNLLSVFSTQILSCGSERESLYVLDGLVANDTDLQPDQHHTDTHGYTEHIFALCYLLGIAFMPRIKNLKKQRLYKIDKSRDYGALEPLFCGTVDIEIIREQWDQMGRVAASLKNRLTPAHVIVKRLANSSDRLAKAFTMLGRIIKTAFVLRYIHEEDLRRMTLRQLNYGEMRQYLAQHLFFADQGDFLSRDYEQIMNKASCLSLLSNAALVWNTVKIMEIVDRLEMNGEIVNREALSKVLPLCFEHIIPTGTYNFIR
jgi:TnpA family transposase